MPDIIIQPLQAPFLKLAPSAEAYALHKAALEWDLLEPIVLEKEEDFKSKIKWQDLVTPYKHQAQNLVTFCRRLPVTLLADDVGLGKTISAGLILSELLQRSRVSKVLIICPRLLMPQWETELKEKFGISSVCETGGRLKHVSKQLQESKHTALITTYQSARRYLDDLERAGFQMLILDEAHKLRNLHGTASPPDLAVRIKKSLAARTFKYVLMLTATPIHNRLWDIYSLVSLLSIARGHQNPFGDEATFAQRYIADSATYARKLKTHQQQEFRSIVYNYMSRVRRQDADLIFPERIVRTHAVQPTEGEDKLFLLIAEPIQHLNPLAQTSIAKALVSSPQALASQLNNMAAKGTFPPAVAKKVADIVADLRVTAKLEGLASLLSELRADRPEDWRLVIFTELRETQNAIGAYLGSLGVPCAYINGDSSVRNQAAIESFKANPPRANVIISTAAGAEGVNLQVANVLLNYDLPWNPMIVEQRVGRVQRLGSNHKNVIIINSILSGTFEEKIVARLMEKLQLASHAIGDIESLLEAAGLEGDEEESKFEDMLRKLVLASLAGKDVRRETEQRLASISQAKEIIKKEEHHINSLLGAMDNRAAGPRPPRLSTQGRSMSPEAFIFGSFKEAGVAWREERPGVYMLSGPRESRFVFDEKNASGQLLPPVLYTPGRPEFDRLVGKHVQDNECYVEGLTTITSDAVRNACRIWVDSFGGRFEASRETAVSSSFSGDAVLRVRVSTAHDSYEKLVELPCLPGEGEPRSGSGEISKISPQALGVNLATLVEAASKDPDILEFCRFYLERLREELPSAGSDVQRTKKLTEDFTPRLQPDLVGLKGSVNRKIQFLIDFRLGDSPVYSCELTVEQDTGAVLKAPPLETYAEGLRAPSSCFQPCAVSGRRGLRHLLVQSEASDKYALPEYIVQCSLTNKRVLSTEVAVSDLSGKVVLLTAMRTSAVSGRRGEPSYFGSCAFTNSDVLLTELDVSQISGKHFRTDEAAVSAISQTRGHRAEFIKCQHTGKWLLPDEAERCDITGELVAPGVLKRCELSNKKVLPTLVGECAVTRKTALLEYLVVGSITPVQMLKSAAIVSCSGNYCQPAEAVTCAWDGKLYHPEDTGECALSGLQISRVYLYGQNPSLKALLEALNSGEGQLAAGINTAHALSAFTSLFGPGNYVVASSAVASEGNTAVVVVDSKRLFGFIRKRHGFVFSVQDGRILGKVATGKMVSSTWMLED